MIDRRAGENHMEAVVLMNCSRTVGLFQRAGTILTKR